jgi:acyl transferase domain-containing protein
VRQDAIALVGVACRLPQSPDPDSFWRLLRSSGDAVTEPPAGRGEGHGAAGSPDGNGVHAGGFLERVDLFDADFFDISPREAEAMDPRQRMTLELGWEALEDAGLVPARLAGSRTAVLIGAMGDGYAAMALRHGPAAIGSQSMTGLHRSIIANRVSHLLGLRGPSMVVDTGQSSSLVAVHLACESLRSGEAALAHAGGVNLSLTPEETLRAARSGGLSADGRCFTFDARANGYVRGEGGVVVVLKPLARALADSDPIYCVILGSAVNNDGATDHLTAPNPQAQAEVVRLACDRAGVDPADIQYVELHGTGTRVGDPVEAAALGTVLGTARPPGSPLAVGSVKTNIGHLEGAAGIAGLLKTALSIRHRELPASLNFATPHPRIPLVSLNLRVQASAGQWPHPDRPLLAGVSSFGMGGTNCHVVLSDGDRLSRSDARRRSSAGGVGAASGHPPDPVPVPWVVSAKTGPALRASARRLADQLARQPDLTPAEVGHALACTRSTFQHRAVVVGSTREELLAGLDLLARDKPSPRVVRGTAGARGAPVFVFPGGGPLRAGAARDLLKASAAFARRMRECDDALAPQLGWSVRAALVGDPDAPPLDRAGVAAAVRFAIMISLAALWREYGIEPGAVIGHGGGEPAAACVAGERSLDDAAREVAAREPSTTEPSTTKPSTTEPSTTEPAALPDLLAQGHRTFIEISPHPVLVAHLRRAVASAGQDRSGAGLVTGTLHHDGTGMQQFLTALAEVHVQGTPVRWARAFAAGGLRRVRLPSYPFQQTSFWLAASEPAGKAAATTTAGRPAGPAATSSPASPLAGRLAALSEVDRHRLLVDLVREHAAAVIGHQRPDQVPAELPFREAGFDSMAVVAVGERISEATAVRLPDTLLFDHPTPEAVARHLGTILLAGTEAPGGSLLADLDRLAAQLSTAPPAPDQREQIVARLRELAARLQLPGRRAAATVPLPRRATRAAPRPSDNGIDGDGDGDDLASATDEQLFAALDHEHSTRWTDHG